MALPTRPLARRSVAVQHGHMEPLPPRQAGGYPGSQYVVDRIVEYDAEIFIDLDALVRSLGQAAAKNKSKRARLANGRIEVRVTERRS